MNSSMRKNGSPDPIYDIDDEYKTYTTIRFPIHPNAVIEVQIKDTLLIDDEVQVEVHDKGPVKGPVDIRIRILSGYQTKPLAIKEIAALLGIKAKTGQLKKTLADLKKEMLIEYTIPAKPKSRNQKYRITKKGRLYLKENIKE